MEVPPVRVAARGVKTGGHAHMPRTAAECPHWPDLKSTQQRENIMREQQEGEGGRGGEVDGDYTVYGEALHSVYIDMYRNSCLRE